MRGDFEAYLSANYQGRQFTLEELLAWEDEAGVDVAVVMPNTEVVPKNRELGETLRGNKRTLGCALINPCTGDAAVKEIQTAVRDWGLRGMKLMPVIHKYAIDDPMVDGVMKAARELGIIVSIHSGPDNCHPTRIGNLAKRFPDVTIIMDHMGLPDNLPEGVEAAQQNRNIFLGTTILRFHKRWGDDPNAVVPMEVKAAIDKLGPERVVFGSNMPEYRPIQVMDALRRLNLGPEAEKLIFGENLKRIYGLQ